MVSVLSVLIITSLISFAHAQDLIVKANETRIITDKDMIVDNWIMEDNSIIIFGENVTSWTIVANRASFGDNVIIDGRGAHGNSNALHLHGAHGADGGHDCDHGAGGTNGGAGTDGKNGIDITMTISIASVGNVIIDARGGNGGPGGNGGNGGKGTKGDCSDRCNGGRGGDGGYGGAGGNPGNGGDIVINYEFINNKGITEEEAKTMISNGIRPVSPSGAVGSGGYGGTGGAGGIRQPCNPFPSRKAGPPGTDRSKIQAAFGKAGVPGTITLKRIPNK